MKGIMKRKAEVREWALRRGFDVASTGGLPRYVVAGYSKWLSAATLEEHAQLAQWTEERQATRQQSQLRLAREIYRRPTCEMNLEKIIQKINLFEQQNPGLRVCIIVQRRSEIGERGNNAPMVSRTW
jgi:hypothetical protein